MRDRREPRTPRELIDAVAGGRPTAYRSADLAAAADLLADMLAAAARHGVSIDDLAYVTDLPSVCLDVMTAGARRRRKPGG